MAVVDPRHVIEAVPGRLLGGAALHVVPWRITHGCAPLDASGPERVRLELGDADRRRIAKRWTLLWRRDARRPKFGELESVAGCSEHRRRDVTVGRARVSHVGAQMRHRTTPAKDLDVDLQFTIGDLADEERVHRPQGLRGITEGIGHRAQCHRRDDPTLRQRPQVPRAVDECVVPAVGTALDGGGSRKRCHIVEP